MLVQSLSWFCQGKLLHGSCVQTAGSLPAVLMKSCCLKDLHTSTCGFKMSRLKIRDYSRIFLFLQNSYRWVGMPDISNVQKSPFLKTKTEKGRGKQQKDDKIQKYI